MKNQSKSQIDGTPFSELGVASGILRAVTKMGFKEPSPIQSQAIPVALSGRDILGQAQTGSGKTAAFGIPILQNLQPSEGLPQALIITPTRELAIQVTDEVAKMGDCVSARLLAVFGGFSMSNQVAALHHGVDIVVGTPGRLLDHLMSGTLDPQHVRFLVLDEADEMLDMGFIEDVEKIISCMPLERQTMLFSATMPKAVRRIAENFMSNPAWIQVADSKETTPDIAQGYVEVRGGRRLETLAEVIQNDRVRRAIVFCRTKLRVDKVAQQLKARGIEATAIHGDMSQGERTRVMGQFKKGRIRILVATDVASRGIDVRDVTHVINYDCPQDTDSYVHRIGRTGRAGHSGKALTLVEPKERRLLTAFEKHVGKRIPRYKLASPLGA